MFWCLDLNDLDFKFCSSVYFNWFTHSTLPIELFSLYEIFCLLAMQHVWINSILIVNNIAQVLTFTSMFRRFITIFIRKKRKTKKVNNSRILQKSRTTKFESEANPRELISNWGEKSYQPFFVFLVIYSTFCFTFLGLWNDL